MARSKTGLVLVILYWIACAAAWVDYSSHRGQFLADILLVLLTVPFILLGGLIAGESSGFDKLGDSPALLISAILFCSILIYAFGVLLVYMGSWLRGWFRPRQTPGP